MCGCAEFVLLAHHVCAQLASPPGSPLWPTPEDLGWFDTAHHYGADGTGVVLLGQWPPESLIRTFPLSQQKQGLVEQTGKTKK